jgi:hypothetical protein
MPTTSIAARSNTLADLNGKNWTLKDLRTRQGHSCELGLLEPAVPTGNARPRGPLSVVQRAEIW